MVINEEKRFVRGSDDGVGQWLAGDLGLFFVFVYDLGLIESVCLFLIIDKREGGESEGPLFFLIDNNNKCLKLIEKWKHKGIIIISVLEWTQ